MNILILSQISQSCVQRLKESHNIMEKHINDVTEGSLADVLIVRSNVHVNTTLLNKLPHLKIVIKAGSGVDNIDLTELERRGIKLKTTPVNKYSVSELTLLYILAFRKNFLLVNNELKRANWDIKFSHIGNSLFGSTLGIIGYGKIGIQLSYIANALGMNVLIYDRSIDKPEKQNHLKLTNSKYTTLETLLKESDQVSLHIPLTEETKGLLSAKEISLMKSNSILINTARAELVDYDAIYNALLEKKIFGLGIDSHYNEPITTIDPLLELENVLCSPHIGSQTVENIELIGNEIIKILGKERI